MELGYPGVDRDSDPDFDDSQEQREDEPDLDVDTSPSSRVTRRSRQGQTQSSATVQKDTMKLAPAANIQAEVQNLGNEGRDDNVIDLSAGPSREVTEDQQLDIEITRITDEQQNPRKPKPQMITLFSSFINEDRQSIQDEDLARHAMETMYRKIILKSFPMRNPFLTSRREYAFRPQYCRQPCFIIGERT